MGAPQPPGPPPPEAEREPGVPLPQCPPDPAAAVAGTTMPKRKKQSQQPPPLQPQVPKREETGDAGGGGPVGPPSLLGPPPMANGKPGVLKSAPNWNPPTCPPSVEWINKLCVHAMGYYTAMKRSELATGNLDESHKHDVEQKEPDTKECRLSSQRSPKFKGINDSTTAESPTSSPGQRPCLGRLRPQVWSIWSWLVGCQC